jgi:hypothetical protein
MSTQASVRAASYDEITADPLFKRGYHEIFAAARNAVDRSWSDAEQQAYERGRQFGTVVLMQGEGRVPLTRGYLAHPRAKLLLMMAMRDGDVR